MKFSVQGRKGQNFVEYMIVVTAIAVVLISFCNKNNGSFTASVNGMLASPMNMVQYKNNNFNLEIQNSTVELVEP